MHSGELVLLETQMVLTRNSTLQVGVVSVGPGMEFRRLGSRGVQSVREA